MSAPRVFHFECTLTTTSTGSTTDSGRSFPLGGASSSTTTSGPHTSDLANKADPRVDSDRDGSRGLGTSTGYGSGTGASVGTAHQGDLSRSGLDATTGERLPRGYGEESWTHDHLHHGHEYVGDPCANEPPAPGAVHFTPGPHSLDTTNRLDPHVSGGDIGAPSSTTSGSTSHTGHHHHPGRDAVAGAGLGAAGAGAYEGDRHIPSSMTTQQGTTTAGPHGSDMMNKMDPRVDSDLSRERVTTTAPGMTGTGSTSTTELSTGREHHLGRDAALGGAGAAAVYEGQKHHGHHVPEGTTASGYSNPYPPSSTGTGVGSGPMSSTAGATGTSDGYGSSAGITAGPHSSNLANKADPLVESDLDGRGGIGTSTGTTDPTSIGKDRHYGRDAGLAGVGAGAAYEADKHLRGSHSDTTGIRSMEPSTTQQPLSGTSGLGYGRDSGVTGAGHPESRHQPSAASELASQPTTYDDRDRTREHHLGRDAAVGAGAGAAAVAGGEELSEKDLEREREAAHKQELKDQKAAHKHELKEEKHHQHELEKEHKAHEKAMAKEETKHHKDESKHHKEEPHQGDKKHHGLFGFLHRDKPDKELKEDEHARKEREEGSHVPGVGTTAGTAAGMSEMEKHQLAKEHDRNRLHKDPPPGTWKPNMMKRQRKDMRAK